MGFTVDRVSADSHDYRPKTHPQTSSTRPTSSTRRKTATSALPETICEYEVGNSSRRAVAQALTAPSPPTGPLQGIVQDFKKIFSFKTSTKKERVASGRAPEPPEPPEPPEQTPISRPRARNRQLPSGTKPLSETKPPSRTKSSSGNKPHSRKKASSGNKPPSRTRLSSRNKPPSRTGQPPEARLPRRTRPLPRVREDEPEDKDVIHGIIALYELIDQHAGQFHRGEYTDYARRTICETFGQWIFCGDSDGMTLRIFSNSFYLSLVIADTTLEDLSKTLAVYRHDPRDEGYQDHLAKIHEKADKQKQMIQRHPSKWRIGPFKDNMLRPSVSKDGDIVLGVEYTGVSTFWN